MEIGVVFIDLDFAFDVFSVRLSRLRQDLIPVLFVRDEVGESPTFGGGVFGVTMIVIEAGSI